MDVLARRLADEGIQPGATVALVLPEGPHFLAAILAVSRMSACAPINPELTATELGAYLRELAPAALLVAPEFAMVAQTGRQLGLTVFEAHEECSGLPSEWRLLNRGKPSVSKHEEVAIILQTSATTGRSKLVGLSRSNLLAGTLSTRLALDLTERDRVLLLSPLFHLQGILSAMSQLAAGGSTVVPCGFRRDDFVWWLDRLRPTWYTCGPTMHRALCSLMEGIAPQAPGLRPHSLRFVRSIGAPLSIQLAVHLRRVLGVPVLNGYGMTETGVVASLQANSPPARADSVGKSTGTEIQVWDAEGREASPGVEGEIVLRGPNVIAGYINDPEANQRSFTSGWFRTGDLGRLDAEDFLYVTGRLKEQINRGGEKVNPAEVDDVLALHPAIAAAAAFGVAHPSLGEDVACAVVLRPDAAPTAAQELRAFASERLAPFKVPRVILYVDAIPRGATGKPQRHVLAEQSSKAALANGAPPTSSNEASKTQPVDTIEQKVLALWRRMLGRDDISLDEDFFSAGGDSMQAVVMLSEVEQIVGLRAVLSTESFFHNPTVAHLAEMIQALRAWEQVNSPSEKIVIVPVQDGTTSSRIEDAPPFLYFFPPNSHEGTAFRKLATALGPDWPVALVRPGHMRYRDTPTVIEDAAKQAVAALRSVHPQGRFLLGGYCFGGLIAFEAARLLEQQGCQVALILFDTPVPGYPQFSWKTPFAAEHWKVLRAAAADVRRNRQARTYVVLVLRKVTWNTIMLFKPLYRAVSGWTSVNWIASRAKMDDLPFFRLHRTRVPILHLLATERTNPVVRGAYAAWKQVAEGGLTEFELLGNHVTLFSPANLPGLATAIRSFVDGTSARTR